MGQVPYSRITVAVRVARWKRQVKSSRGPRGWPTFANASVAEEDICFTSMALFSIHALGGSTTHANWHSPGDFRSGPRVDHDKCDRRPRPVVAYSGSEQPRACRNDQRADRVGGRKGTHHNHLRSARGAYRDPDVICSA